MGYDFAISRNFAENLSGSTPKIRLEEAGGAGGEEVRKEFEEVSARDAFLTREQKYGIHN